MTAGEFVNGFAVVATVTIPDSDPPVRVVILRDASVPDSAPYAVATMITRGEHEWAVGVASGLSWDRAVDALSGRIRGS